MFWCVCTVCVECVVYTVSRFGLFVQCVLWPMCTNPVFHCLQCVPNELFIKVPRLGCPESAHCTHSRFGVFVHIPVLACLYSVCCVCSVHCVPFGHIVCVLCVFPVCIVCVLCTFPVFVCILCGLCVYSVVLCVFLFFGAYFVYSLIVLRVFFVIEGRMYCFD